MSVVFSVRIPRRLKEEMDRLRDIVDWREEVTRFLEERVRFYKRRLALMEANKVLEKHPLLPRGLAGELVREDRDSS